MHSTRPRDMHTYIMVVDNNFHYLAILDDEWVRVLPIDHGVPGIGPGRQYSVQRGNLLGDVGDIVDDSPEVWLSVNQRVALYQMGHGTCLFMLFMVVKSMSIMI